MGNILLTILIAGLIALYLRCRPSWRQVGPALLDGFVLAVGLYALGSYLTYFVPFHFGHSEDILLMAQVAFASCLVGSTLFCVIASPIVANLRFKAPLPTDSGVSSELRLMSIIGGVSIFACLYFVYLLFTSPIISQFLSFENIMKYSTLGFARGAVASGSAGYMAPGFIKQFRDTLLPLALFALIILVKRPVRSPMVWSVLLVTILSMVVNGQRSNILILLLGAGLCAYYRVAAKRPEGSRANLLPMVLAGIVAFAIWTIVSAGLGRGLGAGSVWDVAGAAAFNFIDRMSATLPRENMITYPAWIVLGPTDGQSWIVAFGTIFKTNSIADWNLAHLSTTLSNKVNGGYQGDSPLGLPPDIWLAWGWIGLMVVPAIYALFYGLMGLMLSSERSAIFVAVQIYCFLQMPTFTTPFGFVLSGGVICLAFIPIVKYLSFLARRRSHSRPQTGEFAASHS